jgi:DMSO/TMAO reductase YedYZ molybdopterin-dependent catalytic subunit
MLFAMRTNKPSIIASVFLICSVVVAQQAGSSPAPAAAKGGLLVSAYQHAPLTFSSADLKVLAHITVALHNSHTNADETYSGVRLADLLGKLDVPLGSELRGKALANYVVATGSDGYKAVLALAEVDPSFHPGEILVADAMNGQPLDEHSGPLKLVVTEDKRPARSVRNLVSIELKAVP